MPSTQVLRQGPRRRFVEELHEHYRAAKRPTLREISDVIRDGDELAGTASRETIRRMLVGEVVPAQWHTVNALLVALCKLAQRDPHAERWPDAPGGYEQPTHTEALEAAWHAAIDDPAPVAYQAPADDDPPF